MPYMAHAAGHGPCKKLAEPLLGWKPSSAPLPIARLHAGALLRTLASAVVVLLLFHVRVYDLTLAEGGPPSTAALVVGVAASLRYLSEYASARLLPALAGRHGWHTVTLASSIALILESGAIATVSSPLTLGALHVLAGLLCCTSTWESSAIMATMPAGRRRDEAQFKLAACISSAFSCGPMVGGLFLTRYGVKATCTLAIVLVIGAMVVLDGIPDHFPHRQQCHFGVAKQKRHLWVVFMQKPGLVWYWLASWFSTCGMATFGAVHVLWMTACLGWSAEKQGRFMALSGWMVMVAQGAITPELLAAAWRKRWALVKVCFLCSATRFLAFAVLPAGWSLVLALAATAPGFCSTPLLSAFWMSLRPRVQQGSWESWERLQLGLHTSASAVGALLGGLALAHAMQASESATAPLLAAAACFLLAAACANCAQGGCDKQPAHATPSCAACDP